MKPLFDAIMARFNSPAGAAFKASVSGLWLYEAPDGAIDPYAVFMLVDGQTDHTFTETMENPTLQFSIFGNVYQPVGQAGLLLRSCFDWCTLSITGYTPLYMQRTMYRTVRTPLTPNVDVFHEIIEYEVLFQSTP
jgi:hypothetical protein